MKAWDLPSRSYMSVRPMKVFRISSSHFSSRAGLCSAGEFIRSCASLLLAVLFSAYMIFEITVERSIGLPVFSFSANSSCIPHLLSNASNRRSISFLPNEVLVGIILPAWMPWYWDIDFTSVSTSLTIAVSEVLRSVLLLSNSSNRVSAGFSLFEVDSVDIYWWGKWHPHNTAFISFVNYMSLSIHTILDFSNL